MEMILEIFQGRGILWWIGQGGIALEIVGALYIVIAAFKNRKVVKGVDNTWDGLVLPRFRGQVRKERVRA